MRNLIPPKGVKRKSNVEESELLLDCEGDEITIEEQQQEYEVVDHEDESNVSKTVKIIPLNSNPSVLRKRHVRLSNLQNDPDI